MRGGGRAAGGPEQHQPKPGDPCWVDLYTSDLDGAIAFYGEVFGWQDVFAVSDDPAFRYSTIHATSPMLGGVMDASSFLPEGVSATWTVYFGADEVDKAVERVVELGGAVAQPTESTPYGRIATVTDPTGARFSIGGDED